jgi:hypothetical protein
LLNFINQIACWYSFTSGTTFTPWLGPSGAAGDDVVLRLLAASAGFSQNSLPTMSRIDDAQINAPPGVSD